MIKRYFILSILAVFLLSGLAQADKVRINHSQVSTPAGIEQAFNAVVTELDALRAATNLNSTLAADVRDVLKGDYLTSYPFLAMDITSHPDAYVYSQTFSINATMYQATGQAVALAPTSVVSATKIQAYAFDVGINKTIDVTTTAVSTGYATTAAAIAALPAVAADHVRVGYMTVVKSDGNFTPDTTALDATNVSTGYTVTDAYISGMSSAAAGTAVTEQVIKGK